MTKTAEAVERATYAGGPSKTNIAIQRGDHAFLSAIAKLGGLRLADTMDNAMSDFRDMLERDEPELYAQIAAEMVASLEEQEEPEEPEEKPKKS